MEKFTKLTREEMKRVVAGMSPDVQKPVCGNGSCKASSDCGTGGTCSCIKEQCSSVS